MIGIIVDNHVHRLLQSGVVESSPIEKLGDSAIITNEWKTLNPETDLQIPAGDFHAFIKEHLEVLHSIFPADRKPLPSSEKVEVVISKFDEVKV